jgi:MFS superfamily sulfate permease-like transporter
VPDSRGRSLRAQLRAPPVLGGLLPVRRPEVAADLLAGITLAAVSIPVSLGYAKIAGMPVVTGLYTLLLARLARLGFLAISCPGPC